MIPVYLLFICELYYPHGGADDFVATFKTIEEAKARAELEIDGDEYRLAKIASWDGERLTPVMSYEQDIEHNFIWWDANGEAL